MISNKVLLIFIIVIFIKSCIGLNNEGITFVINNNIFIFKLKYDKYVYSVYLLLYYKIVSQYLKKIEI